MGQRDHASREPRHARRAPKRDRVLAWLVVVASVYGLVGRWHFLVDIPRYHAGLYGTIARNYIKYGYPDFGLAQIVSPGPRVPEGQRLRYQNHPPLVPLLSSCSIAALGPTAWAVRLPHLLSGIGLVIVLGCLSARLHGRAAAAWSVVFAMALPAGVWFGGAFADVMGSTLVFWMCLAAYAYYRYAQTGRRGHFVLLLGSSVLALLSDWPAFVLCFALAAHALWFHTRARRGLMVMLPTLAVVVLVALWLYQRPIPHARTPWGRMGVSYTSRVTGDEQWRWSVASARRWAADFGAKLVRFCSPLVVLCAPWVAAWTWAAVRTRENRASHHVLVLWAAAVGFAAAVPLIFLSHVYYHLLFFPGVVLTLGAAAATVYGWGKARRPHLAAAAATVVCLFVVSWSYETLCAHRWGPREDYQRRQPAWAEDLRERVPFEETVAFPLANTWQMRFLADRRVHEKVESAGRLGELAASASGSPPRLYAPLEYPFGDAAFGGELLRRYAAWSARAGVVFQPSGGGASPRPAVARHPGVQLVGGPRIDEVRFATLDAEGGRRYLYLGLTLSERRSRRSDEVLYWTARFVAADGRVERQVAVLAAPSASYLVAAPAGWSFASGAVELALEERGTDAARAGRARRLWRLMERLATFGRLGRHRAVVRVFEAPGGGPVVLGRGEPTAGRAAGQGIERWSSGWRLARAR